jgi:hypothetical protein
MELCIGGGTKYFRQQKSPGKAAGISSWEHLGREFESVQKINFIFPLSDSPERSSQVQRVVLPKRPGAGPVHRRLPEVLLLQHLHRILRLRERLLCN